MGKNRKYAKGDVITSFDELLRQDFVYFVDKITPRGWFMSWQIRMAYNAIRGGMIRYAVSATTREDKDA